MGNSYRQILRSSSIIGGASVINILIGLLRMKVAAVLLGPAGVGLIGLLQSLMASASAVAALGVGTVGTRQIAEATGREDIAAVAAARRALFWGTMVLAAFGALATWLLRNVLATWVLAGGDDATAVGWLAVGVALTVASASQSALLNGLRRIGDMARVSVLSALLSTGLGVAALWLWADRGVLAFVLVAPLASFLLGHWYVSKLPRIEGPSTPLPQLMMQWRALVRLGAPFMFSGVVVTIGQLAMRSLVQRELGADALGHFQAAWMISMTYIGFVLGAMGTDYYPRLTTAINDHAATNRMVNEQTEVALLLAAPVFLVMMALAPSVVELLYSRSFHPAAEVLRWQILGDVLKVAIWPSGFVLLAAGDGRSFMLTESLAVGVLLFLTWLWLPVMGVVATGMAFVGMHAVLLPVVYFLARSRTGLRWDARVLVHLGLLLLATTMVLILSALSERGAAITGLASALGFGAYALGRLASVANLGGPLGRAAAMGGRLVSLVKPRRD